MGMFAIWRPQRPLTSSQHCKLCRASAGCFQVFGTHIHIEGPTLCISSLSAVMKRAGTGRCQTLWDLFCLQMCKMRSFRIESEAMWVPWWWWPNKPDCHAGSCIEMKAFAAAVQQVESPSKQAFEKCGPSRPMTFRQKSLTLPLA